MRGSLVFHPDPVQAEVAKIMGRRYRGRLRPRTHARRRG
jgi:hypothetical protein